VSGRVPVEVDATRIDRLEAERDRLLESGRSKAAWELVEATLARFPLGPHAESFLESSVELSRHYFGQQPAKRWIAAYHQRAAAEGLLDDRLTELLKGSELALAVPSDLPRLTRLEKSIRWRWIEDIPWVVVLRLFRLRNRGQLDEALDLLRRSKAHFRKPHDLGNRLRTLADFCVDSGQTERYLRLAGAALRHYSRGGGLRARIYRFELKGRLGRLHLNNGRYEEAVETLEGAIEEAESCHDERARDQYRVDLATVYAWLGRNRDSRTLLERASWRDSRISAAPHHQIRVCQLRAFLALDEGDVDTARAWQRAAQDLLDKYPAERFQAYTLNMAARIAASEGAESSYERALAYLDKAERTFRNFGTAGLHGLTMVLTSRGRIHLLRKEVPQALQCCLRGMEMARKYNFFPLQMRALLLKSYLLVEADLPAADTVYEEVLNDLGLVQNPLLLFKVVANLYLYTWKLDDGLELTDLHMQQLHKLREHLDEDLYRELFARYVTPRVMTGHLGAGELVQHPPVD